MPHTKRPRYITPLEVQSILDGCYGCDCHLAMMQCIAKGINDLLGHRPKIPPPKVSDSFLQECKT